MGNQPVNEEYGAGLTGEERGQAAPSRHDAYGPSPRRCAPGVMPISRLKARVNVDSDS